MDAATFSQRVMRMRERRGMSREELAEKADISYQTLWRIEQRQVEPGVMTAYKLAQALHCSLDYLCGMYEDDGQGNHWPPQSLDADALSRLGAALSA